MAMESHSVLTVPVLLPTGAMEAEVEQRIYLNERGAITGIEYAIYAPASIITWAEEDEDAAGQVGRTILQTVLPALFGEVIPPALTYFVMVEGHCILTSEDACFPVLDEGEFPSTALPVLAKVLCYATVDRAEELFGDRSEIQLCIDAARWVYARLPGDLAPAEAQATLAAMEEARDAMFPPDGEASHWGSPSILDKLD